MSLTHDTTDARLRVPVSAYEPDIEKVLISTEEIESALATMGEQITKDYAGKSLLLVGVLKGAFVVMADLARHIGLPLEFDFMAVSSYGAATKTSGVVRILKDLDHDLDGARRAARRGHRGLRPHAEVPAEEPRRAQARFPRGGGAPAEDGPAEGAARHPLRGVRDPAEFVVGYGLDYAERYRNLPYVATLRPEAYGGE